MNYSLSLNITDTPAALERILRVVRHRGFALTGMNLTAAEGRMELDLRVESEHPLHLLHNQLAKLHDVVHVATWENAASSMPCQDMHTTTPQ